MPNPRPVVIVQERIVPHGPAFVDELLAEVAKTPLGMALCQALDALGVTVIMDAPADQDGQTRFGYYNHTTRILGVAQETPWAMAMHIFAHEARHALQAEVLRQARMIDAFNVAAHPRMAALHLRLREIDADAFAVFFLYDHAVTGNSDHFATMADNRRSPLRRRTFYRDFYAAWQAGGGGHDDETVAHAMRTIKTAWLQRRGLATAYDRAAAALWQRDVHLRSLDADDPRRETMVCFHDGVTDTRLQDLCGLLAARYAAILGDAGSVDYLADVDPAGFVETVAKGRGFAREIGRAVNDYNGLKKKLGL